MSAVTRSIVKEEFEDIGIEPGPGEADVDISELEEISNGLSNDHDELAQVLDEAKIFSDVKDQFPEGTILTVSEEKILNAMVNLIGAGSGGTISAESLRVFKRDTVGTQLSLEAMEGGVWATIKRIFKAIADKIKAFWNWLTGNTSNIEKKQEQTRVALDKVSKSDWDRFCDNLNDAFGGVEPMSEEQWKEELRKHSEQFKRDMDDLARKGTASNNRTPIEGEFKVVTESFDYTPGHGLKIHKISGHQLSIFTDQAPRGAIVFADDVVEAMTKTLNISKKILDILRENELGKVIGHQGSEEAIISKVSEVLERQVNHLGLGGGKEVHVVGTFGLKYDERNLLLQPETMKTDIQLDKNYVVGIRSGSELIRKYGDYVHSWKALGLGGGTLNEIANDLEKYAERTTPIAEAGIGEKGERVIAHFAKFTSALLSALARIVRSAAVLEKNILIWIPVK